MVTPISHLVANLHMEHFEQLALTTTSHPPSLWLRYVDDTYVRIHEYDIKGFTKHINSIDDNIKFTIEPETNSKLPFLDLCTHILDDGSTKLTIYRIDRVNFQKMLTLKANRVNLGHINCLGVLRGAEHKSSVCPAPKCPQMPQN